MSPVKWPASESRDTAPLPLHSTPEVEEESISVEGGT